MKKIIAGGMGVLLLMGILFAFEGTKPSILVTGISMQKESAPEIKAIVTALKSRIKKSGNFLLSENVPVEVLKEIKLKIFQGKKFPPAIEKITYADYLLLLKMFTSKGERYISASLIDEETGEVESSITFLYEGINSVVDRVFAMLVNKRMPVAPESKVEAVKKEYWIKVVAAGRGKGPESVAGKVALLDAKRRAVEKAVGSIVDVKIVPEKDRREIISRAMGYLKYKIVSREVKNGFLILTIEAEVKIPSEYVKKYPALYRKPPLETGFPPLTMNIKGVEADWEKGFLLVEGKGKIGKNPPALLLARRAAIVDAQGKALEALKGVRVNEEKRAGDFGMEYHLRGIVKNGDVVKEWIENGEYHVVMRVPVYGINGLTGLLTDPSIDAPFSYINQNQPSAGENLPYTGVVIDASSLKLAPSVIFRVFDEDGEPVYDEKNVDPESFREMGMAAFVVNEGSDLKLYRKANLGLPLFIASNVDYIYLARRRGRGHHFRYKGKRWWTKRRRQGRRPWRVRAISLPENGKIRTGVVISVKRGKNFRKMVRKLFRTARVVVITTATVGGTEGRKSVPFWMGYLW